MTTPIDRMDPPSPVATPPATPATAFVANLRSSRLLVGVVLAAAFVLLVSAALTLGASPTPTTPGAAPQATPAPKATPRRLDRSFGGAGLFGRGGGAFGFGSITVTGIAGSNVSLKTDDGWIRTIALTSSTKLTKAGKAIALGDIKAGDRIRFRETRNADGTFTIQAVEVILPSVAGKVTAKTADSISVQTAGGGTATIHVSGSTTYRVGGKANATFGDIAIGAIIGAQGEQRADGSLDATVVRAAGKPDRWFGGRGGNLNPKAAPNATPKPGSYTG
jgi:hypothetical protein